MAEKLLDKNPGMGQVSPNRPTAATTSAKIWWLHRTWIRIQSVYLKLDERAIQPRANSATRSWREKVIIQKEVHRGMARAHTLISPSRSHRTLARCEPGGALVGDLGQNPARLDPGS